ncbi:MAG TPA: SDR family oxidoreductase [Gemmatimonadaceae bacterium]|jgi:NADP-dependent 3-hydroxy acid dehydrogenase YdfG
MTADQAVRTALVTGASRGIGLAIARLLAASGVRVALVARSAAELSAHAAELGGGALAVPADVTSAADVARVISATRDAFGDVPDLLVNNAGIFVPKPLHVLTADEFERTIQVNLVAPFLLLRAVLPRWRELGRGHAITIGSIVDRTIFADNGAYSASKFGARGMHEVLRAETKGSGIRATLVAPSSTDTPIWDSVDLPASNRYPPRERMLSAQAVAEAVVWAAMRPSSVNVDELRLSAS